MRTGDDAERYRDQNRDEHRADGECDRGWITFEDQARDGTIVAERKAHVAVKQRAPVVGVTIFEPVPGEVTPAVVVAWKREEERRTIESVLFAKLRVLFGSRLFAENCD